MDSLNYNNWEESYDEMVKSFEHLVAEIEARSEFEKEEKQLKYLEEKGSK